MSAPLPNTEAARLDALRQCRLLDTAPDAAFDDLTRLAAQICGTPIAAVSLIDEDRQWFKSILGLAATQTPRSDAFCAHTILQSETLIVPDAAADERFADNPLVTSEPNIRFYAGAPLITPDGHALGSLCVIDRIPRQLTPEQLASLQALARQVASQIELNRRIAVQVQLMAARERSEAALRRSEARMAEAQQIAHIGDWEYEVKTQKMTWSEEVFRLLGFDPAQEIPRLDEVLLRYHPEDLPARNAAFQQALRGKPYEIDVRVLLPGGNVRWCHVIGCPFRNDAGEIIRLAGTTMDVTERKEAAAALQQAHDHLETRVQERTAALQVSEERYRFMADAMPNLVWTASPDGSLDYYNRRWYEYTGQTFDQAKDWGWQPVLHPEDLENCLAHWTHSLRTGEPYEVEYRFKRAFDGAYRWHLGRAFPLRDPAGNIIQWVGACTDIHDYKEAEHALRQAQNELEDRVRQRTAELASASRMLREDQERLEQAQAMAHVGSWEIDCVTGEKHWSAEMFRIFGLIPAVEPPQMDWSLNIVHPEDRAAIYACMQEALTTGKPYRLEHRVVWADGTERHVQARCELLRGEDGLPLALHGTAMDITERKLAEQSLKDFSVVLEFQKLELEKANAELEALATLDGLTGLRNRRTFDSRLQEEFERASRYQTPLSLVLLDIDHFKHYNDTFGHQAGDEALRMIGRILQKATRETDFVARYGGEEMALILPETDGDGAIHVAERVRMAIATAFWEHREVTASLGVCTLRLGMEQPSEMIAYADRALYQSKADGRNRITHSYTLADSPLEANEQPGAPK